MLRVVSPGREISVEACEAVDRAVPEAASAMRQQAAPTQVKVGKIVQSQEIGKVVPANRIR